METMPTTMPTNLQLVQTRKRGQMNRIRAIALGLAAFAASAALSRGAWAQETTGRITGRVTDKDTGAAMGGVTVIVQGPQGEDATVTDDKGQYQFTSLTIGTYVLRYYVANTSTQVEQPNVSVSALKTVRVNNARSNAVQTRRFQTFVPIQLSQRGESSVPASHGCTITSSPSRSRSRHSAASARCALSSN